MEDDLDALAVRVRTDTVAFARDVADLRDSLREGLGREAEGVGRSIEESLRRAARSGRIEFEDFGKAAVRALGEIAGAALKLEGGGLSSWLAGGSAGLLGLPGRATGGPVSPGRAYVVGERGPELFVPTSSGRVETSAPVARPVRLTVNLNGADRAGTGFMVPAARQVAREVRMALERLDG